MFFSGVKSVGPQIVVSDRSYGTRRQARHIPSRVDDKLDALDSLVIRPFFRRSRSTQLPMLVSLLVVPLLPILLVVLSLSAVPHLGCPCTQSFAQGTIATFTLWLTSALVD